MFFFGGLITMNRVELGTAFNFCLKVHFLMFQWCERRRFDIAGLMSSVLRAHMQAYDPVFSMTLRYLIRFFSLFSSFFLPPLP